MSKFSLAFVILVSLTVIAVLILVLIIFVKPQIAGISVISEPPAIVLIDGVEVGKTPYEGTYQPKEVDIKLIPEFSTNTFLPYETRVDLISGVKTVVAYSFAQTKDQESAKIISFEKGINRETGITVISEPLDADVFINGSKIGVTPYKGSLLPGEYLLTIEKTGYESKTLSVRVVEGYKLTAWVKLALLVLEDDKEQIENKKTQQNYNKKYVVILETDVGFLRVRKNASSLSEEIGRVLPKEEYELMEIDEKTGWYKIILDDNTYGYVSNEFAKLKEDIKQ
ncbi:MAG: PEGA domain-containing protein [Patescibacteria group bacterium]|nr:PEGA domain-containing protein [Patescibacteria group bacterium]